MNKLFSKIAALSVGLTMAIGVGVAVGSKEARVVKADGTANFTLSSASSVTVDGVTAAFDKNSGGTAPTWYAAGLRLYASNTVTISSSNTISAVSFNWEKQGTKAFATVTASVGNYNHPSTAGVGSWSGSANSIVFTLGDSGQLQLNTFSVTYSGGPSVSYTITYDKNGGTGSMSSTTNTVAECTFTAPEGKQFSKWNTAANGSGTDYAPGSTATSDLDLYAIWEEAPLGGTINFGNATGSTQINDFEITGEDSSGLEWTVTTVASEKSFTQQPTFSQIGSSSKPATSITFTATLASSMKVVAFSAKFGGFSGTAGDIALKVDDTTVGTGNLSAATDVVVEATDVDQSGTTLTITVSNIAKGVKAYYVSYELESGVDPSKDTLVVKLNDATLSPQTLTYSSAASWLFYANDKDDNDINSEWESSDPSIFSVTKNGNNVAVVTPHKGGTATLTASASGYNSGSFILTVDVGTVTTVTVSGSMTKTSYYVGESWSHDGLVATASYSTGYEGDVSSEAVWTYSAETPVVAVTSLVVTATFGGVSGNSAAQAVTVTRTNPLKALYSKSSGDTIEAYGYYVGFSAADGAYIMDGEYGFLIGDRNLDCSGYTENVTVLHASGKLYLSHGQYKFDYSGLTVTEVTDQSIIDQIEEPVIYAAKGGETVEHESRSTTVTGKVKSVTPKTTAAADYAWDKSEDVTIIMTVGSTDIQVFFKKLNQTAELGAEIMAALSSQEEITVKGYIAWYDAMQVSMVGIIEASEDYTAEEFAQDLLDQTDAVCVNYVDGESSYAEFKALLTTIWNNLQSDDKYPSLPADQKTILAEAERDESGTVVEQAMARYDFLAGKYDLSNFITGRTPMVFAGNRDYADLSTTNSTMVVIVVIASISVLAFTTLLVFKKKKQK